MNTPLDNAAWVLTSDFHADELNDEATLNHRDASATIPLSDTSADEYDDNVGNEDRELEVEEEEYIIPYAMRTSITIGNCAEWTQLIHVLAMHKGKEIGRADGRYIDRDQIREYFYDAMDEPSQDTLNLATELFDTRGRLKSEFRAGEGSGIWGSEMNTGSMLLLQTIQVEKEWRGKGVGRDIMEAFMKKGQSWKEDVQFVFVKPDVLHTKEVRYDQESMTQQQARATTAKDRKKAISFCRALGLRRVADSGCFATTFDPLHAVHQLTAEDDYEPREDTLFDIDNKQKALDTLVSEPGNYATIEESFRQEDTDDEDNSLEDYPPNGDLNEY